jgi:hypothetical protein
MGRNLEEKKIKCLLVFSLISDVEVKMVRIKWIHGNNLKTYDNKVTVGILNDPRINLMYLSIIADGTVYYCFLFFLLHLFKHNRIDQMLLACVRTRILSVTMAYRIVCSRGSSDQVINC